MRETTTATGTDCDGVKREKTPRRSRGKIRCTRQHRAGSLRKKSNRNVPRARHRLFRTIRRCLLLSHSPCNPMSCETNDYTVIDSLRRERPVRSTMQNLRQLMSRNDVTTRKKKVFPAKM